jgi:uncharacterized membrane protein YvlD (DUF360 family)
MHNHYISSLLFIYCFRVGILIASLSLFISLEFYLKNTLFFIPVIAPVAMALAFSFMGHFKKHPSKLIAFSLPILVMYCLGFYPWITNYEQVAISSSTASLDFIILPIWSTIYGFVLLGIYELIMQVVMMIKGSKTS